MKIGVIGLGVMGQRMLQRLDGHQRLQACVVFDTDAGALQRTLAARPQLRAADSAAALICSPGLDGLYIATPPAAHMELSHAAFDAGLAVLCEKPLTVDFAAARRCIERIEREGRRAAVNYSLASSPGLRRLQQAFGAAAAELGELQQVEIDVAFAAWPRPWQAAAGAWLSQRAEGGFTREVLSHFVFVLQRLLGPATVQGSQVEHATDGLSAETSLRATLSAGGVPVQVHGRIDATLPVAESNRMLWQGSRGAIELRDWFGLFQQAAHAPWKAVGDAAQLRAEGQSAQLDQWLAELEGRPHSLPGYAEALAVQQTIEAMLAGEPQP